MQHALAEIRTDLDKFSEVEADALMYSGYRQTLHAFDRNSPPGFPLAERVASDRWRFLRLADSMRGAGPDYDATLRELRKGRHRFLRRFRRGRPSSK